MHPSSRFLIAAGFALLVAGCVAETEDPKPDAGPGKGGDGGRRVRQRCGCGARSSSLASTLFESKCSSARARAARQ